MMMVRPSSPGRLQVGLSDLSALCGLLGQSSRSDDGEFDGLSFV